MHPSRLVRAKQLMPEWPSSVTSVVDAHAFHVGRNNEVRGSEVWNLAKLRSPEAYQMMFSVNSIEAGIVKCRSIED